MRIVIIGSGNVADALATAVSSSEHTLVQMAARNKRAGEAIAARNGASFSDNVSHPAEADLYLIAVSDRVIREVAGNLHIPENAVVAHTAGGVNINVLPENIQHGAVVYPFQTFTKGRKIDFKKIPLFIEYTTPHAENVVRKFAESLSDRVMMATSDNRATLHLAAVYACNFSNHMYTVATQILHEGGLSFELLKPMIEETAAKAIASNSPQSVQTGPAVRGDREVIEQHIALQESDGRESTKDFIEIYKMMSESIWETSRKISQE